jgi:WD40 repeat protein
MTDLAGQASAASWAARTLVRCYPRRWRQRYGDELLAVLEQHHASPRTVLNLAVSALSTHLDPAYRMEGVTMARLRAWLVAAGVVLLFAGLFGWWVHGQTWKDGHWHIGIEGAVGAMAFDPGRQIMVTATSNPMDGANALWSVANPARPRRLAIFEGGPPTDFSPDGRMVATTSFDDQLVLWTVSDVHYPRRIARLATPDHSRIWGEAFSPDGHVLAAAYDDRLFLWDVADPAKPRIARSLPAPVGVMGSNFQGDIAFSPNGHLLASAVGRSHVAIWDVADPEHATRIATITGSAGFIDALAFSPDGKLLADVSFTGAVNLFSLKDPATPRRLATMQTLATVGRTVTKCTNSPGQPSPPCPDVMYALAFSSDARTLTAIGNAGKGPGRKAAVVGQVGVRINDFGFAWNVTNPASVIRIASFVHHLPTLGSDDGYQPAIAPDGTSVIDGAPFGYFGVTIWTMPTPPT